ncbi:hydrolase [Actinomadura sp. NBRC 104412]|uniref:alpha/beta fold hydrolase n=1 Tax=Actinomadura sp. NBRC 104412 TaxID=3032203 RepID=UPI0024A5F1AA|nr:alpha/beta fold hydrolase [Actinomadura sp. NBRC 104412]GLZ09024.1 hydrolase [Actinomadura sp. NBRC 104412]
MSRSSRNWKTIPPERTRHGLAYVKVGDGPPLVLVHGIGGSHHAWGPVIDRLADSHTVYAVDLPGHGDSRGLDGDRPWTPRRHAEALATALDDLDIDNPHVAGNSLGGWVGLELANLRPVASLTLLSPAGLWKRRQPVYCAVSLFATWFGCRYNRRPLAALSRRAWGRRLVFWQVYTHPENLTPEHAIRDLTVMAGSSGFRPTMRACKPIRYQAGRELIEPVTLAFGESDRILLPRQSRHTDQLPPHTRRLDLPDAGHVPMSDNPEQVCRVILATTGKAVS